MTDLETGMRWRVMVELIGADGVVLVHEVSAGGSTIVVSPATVGLTMTQGKQTLAGLQRHLIQAQVEDHCRERRRCSHCGLQRPIKDIHRRRLLSLFGTVEVRAPRFAPCRCAVTCRRTLCPITEIMPDRCTPDYERVVAKIGALLPYRRAQALLSEFLPLNDQPAIETVRQRTLHVGARLEKAAIVSSPTPSTAAQSITMSIDGGHVRSVRSYQMRLFEILLAQVGSVSSRTRSPGILKVAVIGHAVCRMPNAIRALRRKWLRRRCAGTR